jgi:microcystin-dependent protein
MPAHQHTAQGTTSNADSPIPTGNLLGAANNMYASPNAGNLTTLDPTSMSSAGASQPHENMQPYLVLNYCIALVGIFPARS